MADVVDPRMRESALIVVRVGCPRDCFQTIPRMLLLSRTNIFSKHPTASFDNVTAAVIDIPSTASDDLRYLTIYASYLRRGSSELQFPLNNEGKAKVEANYHDLFALYIFGGKLQDEAFQDDVMDAILAKYKLSKLRWRPGKGDVVKLYDETSKGSPLRKFIVQAHIWADLLYGFNLCRYPAAFEDDLVCALVALTPNASRWLRYVLVADIRGQDVSAKIRGLMQTLPCIDQATMIPASVSCCDFHLHAEGAICGNRKRKRVSENAAV